MKNSFLTNKEKYNQVNESKKFNHIQQNFKPNTVDINKLLNRVKINEKNKTKENLVYLGLAILAISIISLFLII